jgi:site-specific DNA recombinase
MFDEVQAVLKAHNLSGERDRKHPHYLKGTVYCGVCRRRLTYSEDKGNGGTYAYFVCPLKQRKHCSGGYFRVDRVEEAIERYYATVVLSAEHRDLVRTTIRAQLEDASATNQRELKRCDRVLKGLDEQERKLLRTYYEDQVSPTLYAEEQARIQREREQIQVIKSRLQLDFEDVEHNLDLALSIVADAEKAYLRATPHLRRLMNQAIFARIEICNAETITGHLAEPLATLGDREFFETVWGDIFSQNGPRKASHEVIRVSTSI